MPTGLSIAIALFAQTALAAPVDPTPMAVANAPPTYGPVQPAPTKPPKSQQAPETAEVQAKDRCAAAPASSQESTNQGEIVVCAQRPEGYRLNPDVMEAKRQMRSGRPKPPERMKDNSCASVGPMGCSPGGVDLVSAALVAATMVAKAVRGENIGKMFITHPEPSEYQLYVEAKRQREAKEAEAAAEANAKAVQARLAAQQPTAPQ